MTLIRATHTPEPERRERRLKNGGLCAHCGRNPRITDRCPVGKGHSHRLPIGTWCSECTNDYQRQRRGNPRGKCATCGKRTNGGAKLCGFCRKDEGRAPVKPRVKQKYRRAGYSYYAGNGTVDPHSGRTVLLMDEETNCPYPGCQWRDKRRLLREHRKECHTK